MEPLVFAILKSLTPKHIKCVLFDERLEEISYDEQTDLVAMTVETFTAKRSYEIARIYRNRNIPVVMGGFHPTLMPEEVMEHSDSIVKGDAEGIWPDLVKDAEKGELKRVYKSNVWPEISGIIPDRTIFENKKYTPVHLLQFSRGCRFNCDFCSIHSFYGHTLRQRRVQDLVEEINGLEKKHVFFADDNIFVNKKKASELLNALIPLKVKWSCQVSIDIVKNVRLLQLMKKSGCFSVLVGLETLNENNLKQMNKNWTSVKDYKKSLKQFKKHKIMVTGTFVIGYDYDTPDTFEKILNFAIKNKFFLSHFNPLMPTPGTGLYERLDKEKRLLKTPWWLHPDYRYGQAMFVPKNMTPEQLEKGCYDIRTRFNSFYSIFKRALNFKSNLRNVFNIFIFFTANYITRKEVSKKQGIAFGNSNVVRPGHLKNRKI